MSTPLNTKKKKMLYSDIFFLDISKYLDEIWVWYPSGSAISSIICPSIWSFICPQMSEED